MVNSLMTMHSYLALLECQSQGRTRQHAFHPFEVEELTFRTFSLRPVHSGRDIHDFQAILSLQTNRPMRQSSLLHTLLSRVRVRLPAWFEPFLRRRMLLISAIRFICSGR
jgi:hypothetical protein